MYMRKPLTEEQKEKARVRAREWGKIPENKIRRKETFKKKNPTNPEYNKLASQKYRQKLKSLVINKYGGKCVCCGEEELEFLSIDHINQNGAEHRRSLSRGGGDVYRSIRDEGFIENEYRVMCFNCNWSAYRGNGTCIHKR